MPEDPDQPVTLTTAGSEGEAAIIVAALEDSGFKAQMSGQLTSGFRAEAPGEVRVLVRRADLESAREALRQLHEQSDDAEGGTAG
ncbi:MAG: putative signal transducing protein [Planctomycetota bacterium]|jgi:hypothetical protein